MKKIMNLVYKVFQLYKKQFFLMFRGHYKSAATLCLRVVPVVAGSIANLSKIDFTSSFKTISGDIPNIVHNIFVLYLLGRFSPVLLPIIIAVYGVLRV